MGVRARRGLAAKQTIRVRPDMIHDMPETKTHNPFSSERLTNIWLPLALLILLLAAVAGVVIWGVNDYRTLATTSTADKEQHFVFRRLTDPLHLAGRDYLWLVVLIPVLAAGFFFIG